MMCAVETHMCGRNNENKILGSAMAFTQIFKRHISQKAVAIVFEFSIRSDLWGNRPRVQ